MEFELQEKKTKEEISRCGEKGYAFTQQWRRESHMDIDNQHLRRKTKRRI